MTGNGNDTGIYDSADGCGVRDGWRATGFTGGVVSNVILRIFEENGTHKGRWLLTWDSRYDEPEYLEQPHIKMRKAILDAISPPLNVFVFIEGIGEVLETKSHSASIIQRHYYLYE